MGRDKALLEIGGEPLWERQQKVLAAAGATEIFLSARPDQSWTRRVSGFAAVLHDALPECGPLVGVTAGIERASHSALAVLAIDLPEMSAVWFQRLMGETMPGVGVVGRRGEFYEPLAAIYPREIMWLAWEALARGDYSLQWLMAQAVKAGVMREHAIAAAEETWFANWNREGDWVARPFRGGAS
jgi:molybdopterin-guanine dinucleotide biosynthesis protein A